MTPNTETIPSFGRTDLLAVTAAIGTAAIVGMAISLSLPLLSLEMERMGASATVIGLSTTVSGIAGMVTIPLVPRLAAKVGVVRLMALCVAASVLMFPLFKVTYSIAWWFLLRALYHIPIAALFVLSEYWINVTAPPERRGFVMGVYATVLSIGFAAGPAVLLAALPIALARGLTPDLPHGKRRGIVFFVLAAPAATLAALMFGAIETANFTLLPIYALRLGFTAENAAFLNTILGLGNVVFQIPLGLLSDRMDRRVLLIIVGIIGVAGAVALPFIVTLPTLFYVVLFVWGGIIAALYTVGLAHLGARFTGADLAGANAVFIMLYTLGLIGGTPLVGIGMDVYNPHGFAVSLAGLFGIYVTIVLVRVALQRPA
jgi:MFS family permease